MRRVYRHIPVRFVDNRQKGFTIVELLIVVVVIAILAAITIVAYNGIQRQAITATLKSDLTTAAKQLEVEKIAKGTYPASKEAANDNKGLQSSADNYLEYTLTDGTYCMTVSSEKIEASFNISNESGAISDGSCAGHSGEGNVTTQPDNCPSGFIPVPGNSAFGTEGGFCVMKYEAKDIAGTATSQPGGSPWVSISQVNALSAAAAACSGCHLISEAEWLTIAHNVISVAGNWSGGSVGSGYMLQGHSYNNPASALAASSDDTNGTYGYTAAVGTTSGTNSKRTLTLTNGEIIWDFTGNVSEWTSGQTSGGQPGASGYAWRQWNDVSGTGSLTPSPHPNYGTPAASSWTNAQGIGRVYSDTTQSGLRGFRRGGGLTDGVNVGVFTLLLNGTQNYIDANLGFRATQ